jgi:hypothetical protein
MMTNMIFIPVSSSNQMPTPQKAPKYKKGDRVTQRGVIRLTTTRKQMRGINTKYNDPKRGIIKSDGYLDKPDKGGKRHYAYDVQWDGRTHTDRIRQNVIMLEDSE